MVLAMILPCSGCHGPGDLRSTKGAETSKDSGDEGDGEGGRTLNGDDAAEPALPPGFRKVDRKLNKPPFHEHFEGRHPWWDDDEEDEAEEPESWPNAQSPGPDMANFPNSAFTIPRGAFQVEFAPLALSGPSDDTGPSYSTQFLLRYGLTDHLELRLFGLGFAAILRGPQRTTGFSPIAFDLKANLWDESEDHLIPAVGLEAYVQTIYGSPVFRSGTQPALSLLFDHTLPKGFNFEWNVGFNGAQSQVRDNNDINGPINTVHNQLETEALEFNLQWALQRRFFDRLDLFTHGYLNSSAIPNLGDGVVVGGGAVWMATRKVTVFGSYNAGLNKDAPTTSAILGGSWAY
jgi:hypothetical protein